MYMFLWKAIGTSTKAAVVYSAPVLGVPMTVRHVVGRLCPMVRKQAPYRDSDFTLCLR